MRAPDHCVTLPHREILQLSEGEEERDEEEAAAAKPKSACGKTAAQRKTDADAKRIKYHK